MNKAVLVTAIVIIVLVISSVAFLAARFGYFGESREPVSPEPELYMQARAQSGNDNISPIVSSNHKISVVKEITYVKICTSTLNLVKNKLRFPPLDGKTLEKGNAVFRVQISISLLTS